MNCTVLCFTALLLLTPALHATDVGVARIDVTPSEPIRLTGYGGRTTNSIGVEQKLWAKALVIGSDREGPALLVTLDNCGIAESTYRTVVSRLTKRTRLTQAGIVISCSHTHSGPCTTDWAPNIFAADIPPAHQATIDRYTRELIDKLESVALEALKNRRPSQLAWAQGEVTFARNRRVVVGNIAQFGANAAGPVDHSLPLLRVLDADGSLRAILANYACHCTTLGGEFNHVCGDWAGYAQEALERDHPGAVALITIGCGADANPHPRGGADFGLALARQHGEEIATEVKRLLAQTFVPLPGRLTTQLKEIRLPFGPQFTKSNLQARATESGIVGYHARKWLGRINSGQKPPDSLYYPISTWRFGDDLALVFLPGEVVVDYALRLKSELDPARLWVSSYSLYVPCYIPSRRILDEGGYEAESSLWYYDRPTRISTNAEDLIIKTVHGLLPRQFLFDKKKAELPDPKTPAQALDTFRTKSNFTVELVASEPLIESPVAIDWDARGRLWVCEMYDYPTGIHPATDTGRKWGENPPSPAGGYKPGGRIKILESTRNDGHYDKATLFLDGLSFPTGVMPWRKGALICAAPDILYAEDTDGDGRADVVRTNFTGFATHNFQARVNGFRWGLDGWLHASSGLFGGKVKSLITGKEVDLGGRDFRIQPDTGEIEPLAGVSQMGRVRDDFDNWFGNDNSTLLWHYPMPDHYLRRNPHVTYPDPRVNVGQPSRLPHARASASKNTNTAGSGGTPALPYDPNLLHPASRTLERFNSPESANRVTSACGIDIYRDVLLGPNYYGNAFICEPVHNLVTRLELEPDGVSFAGYRSDDEQHSEFLASTDNWFRPVQVRTGPDGALWIVDMYRFVIEHPRWIAPERLKTLDVRAGADMGRIYRVYPKGAKLRPIADLTKRRVMASTEAGVFEALQSPNGPTRDLAQIELLARQDTEGLSSFASRLLQVLARSPEDQSRGLAAHVQLLSAMQTLNLATVAIVSAALTNAHPEVRCGALRLSEALPRDNTLNETLSHFSDNDPRVRIQLAFSLGQRIPQQAGSETLSKLALTDNRTRAAVLSSVANSPGEMLQSLVAAGEIQSHPELLASLISTAVESELLEPLSLVFRVLAPEQDPQAPRRPPRLESWRVDAIASLFEALDRHSRRMGDTTLRLTKAAGDAPARLEAVKEFAFLIAPSTEADPALRLACIRLIGICGHEPGVQFLARDILNLQTPLALQSAAVDALARNPGPVTGRLLIERCAVVSPSVRGRILDTLIARPEWAEQLVSALESKTFNAGEITLPQRQRLSSEKNKPLRERVSRLFAGASQSTRAGVLGNYKGLASLDTHVDRGPELFDKNCAQCHAYRGHGQAVGPNLAEFAGKSPDDFVLAILDPNAAINPNFVAYAVETRDGRGLLGIVRNETASGMTIVQGGGMEETILRSDLKEIRASPLSLMPEGLEQALSRQDLADLIAWVKRSAPVPFGTASANPQLAAKNRAEFLATSPSRVTKVMSAPETLPYRSWIGTLPMAYCRQLDGVNRLSWLSERQSPTRPGPQPAGSKVGKVSFRFPVAMGFASQPEGKFTLKLKGQSLLDFNVALTDSQWASPDGQIRVTYTVIEANSEDSNGTLVIEVPASLLNDSDPGQFEVIGSRSNSQRWFGIYQVAP